MKKCRIIIALGFCLALLSGCLESGRQRRAQLEELERQNRADSLMLNDSLAETLAAYFDNHGTPNERMRARYILGRTYADLGEAPKAIETYHCASECSDTSAVDCDFATLCRIHAQTAEIFREQYMPQEASCELDLAIKYGMMARDTLTALICLENKLGIYYQLNLYDSLLTCTEYVYQEYSKRGYLENAANGLSIAIYALLQRHEQEKAKRYIDIYEKYTNRHGNQHNRQGMLCAYHGFYCLYSGRPDSAALYFRKQLECSGKPSNMVIAYKGLYKAYQDLHQKDSVAKYVELYNTANDSSNIFKSAERLQRVQSLYKYEKAQKIAAYNRQKAENSRWLAVITFVVAVAIVLLSFLWYQKRLSDEKHYLNSVNQKYNNTLEAYRVARNDLDVLQKDSQALVAKKEEELTAYRQLLAQYEPVQTNQYVPDDNLYENPLLKRLHNTASVGKTVSDTEIDSVLALIDQHFPNFFPGLDRITNKLSHKQRTVCALTKLYFIPSEIGALLNMRYQAVTNMRSRLAKLLFGEHCKTADFDIGIHSLG